MARVYVASSWRNKYQPEVVKAIREAGHEAYDFREPRPGDKGFGWSEIHPEWLKWTPEQFIQALKNPIAERGFSNDKEGLEWCTHCLLVLPSGRSAHLEAGWAIGQHKPTAVYMPELPEPELMYKLFETSLDPSPYFTRVSEVNEWLKSWED